MNKQEKKDLKDLIESTTKYSVAVVSEFEARWDKWPIDIYKPGPSEVLIGLARRQCKLALALANNLGMWTPELAPLLLRPMVEGYIYLAWILIDPEDRSLKFVEDGLGKEKLVIKHRTEEMKTNNLNPDEDELLQASKWWIEEHKYSFYIDVNLGASWSGLDLREMADQANCGDFYRYTYPMFSSTAHSRWNHIGKFDLTVCADPLHGMHRVPVVLGADYIDPQYWFLAAKYLDKTFLLIDSSLNIDGKIASAFKEFFPNAD